MAYLFDTGIFSALGTGSSFLAGAKLYFYSAGTSTPKDTYTSIDLDPMAKNANPVVADASGRWGPIWFDDDLYKYVLTDSSGTPIANRDNVGANGASKELTNLSAAILGIDTDYQSSGYPAVLTEPMNFTQEQATATDVAQTTFLRQADFTGGTVGFVNNALRALSEVDAGVTSFEWALLARLDNSATAGENNALYAQGNKLATGPTWAATLEAIDHTATANPSTGLVTCEGDVRANGTDDNNQRVCFDAVITRPYSAGSPTGAAMEAGWAFRVQNSSDASATVKIGYGFYTGTTVVTGFDTSVANVTGDAIRLATGQTIAFDASSQHRLRYESTVGLTYSAAGDDKVQLESGGSIWTKPLTFATLPAAGEAGRRAFITDCNTTTFNASAAGGGSSKVPVFDDGAAWRVG